MRVLTFNSHQPYLHLLAASLPWTLGVVTPRLPSGRLKPWNDRIRPLPVNVRLYPTLEEALRDSSWDWFLAHNVHDLLDCRNIVLPKVFLVHGTLSGRMLQDRSDMDRAEYLKNLRLLLRSYGCRVVYVSPLKQQDWGIPGEVIRSAVDPSHYGGYHGEIKGVLQVCNHLRQRGAMLGWAVHQSVCRDIPTMVIGENRGLMNSRVASSWEDLKEQYRSYRLYLHTAVYPFEDGYNLALLEAMATGMPVAAVSHPTSPIVDGVEGVVGSTAEILREKIIDLLENPQKAIRLGLAAKLRAERDFSIIPFQQAWQSLAQDLIGSGSGLPPADSHSVAAN